MARPLSGTCVNCCQRLKSCSPNKRMVKIYVAVFLALLTSSFSITMLFPFLPFLVEFLLPELDETAIGKYAGIIASAMFLGRVFGSYIWGGIADYKGRKPVIISSVLLMGLSSAAFGFSVHIAMAVVFRFCVGFFNGVVGTAKAVIGEASDNRNQAFGISVLASAWGLGFIIGPAVSGAIADPIGQYHLNISDPTIRSFLTKFPYSLPCLVNLLLCLVTAAVVFCLLPETLGTRMNKKKMEDELLADEDDGSSSDSRSPSLSPTPSPLTPSQEEEEAAGGGCEEVDLGRLGRRPFATREDVGGDRRSSLNQRSNTLTLNVVVEEEDTEGGEVESALPSTEDSGVSTGCSQEGMDDRMVGSTGAETFGGMSDSSLEIEMEEGLELGVVGCEGVGEQLTVQVEADSHVDGTCDDIDLGELRLQRPPASTNRRPLPRSGPAHDERAYHRSGHHRRRSSFLIPFFNRRDSFTLSYVKPSLSALRRLHKRKGDMSGEEEGEEEEEEDEEGGGLMEPDTKELIPGEKKVTFRKKAGRVLKNSFSDVKQFLCNRESFLALLIYCTFSFALIGFDELYSLWASAQPHLGGLGWSLNQIGISLAITGCVLLPFSLFIYPVIERRLGSIMSFFVGCIPHMVLVMLLPNLHFLVPLHLTPLLWFSLCVVMIIIRVTTVICMASMTLFMNNSVTFDKLGAFNGFAASLTAVFRTVSPLVAGGLFSVSLSDEAQTFGYPIDYHLIFLIFGGIFLLTNILTAMLPESINRQKVVED